MLTVGGKGSFGLQTGQPCFHHFYQLPVVNIADRAENHVFRRIVGFHVGTQLPGAEAPDQIGRAENRPTHRLTGKSFRLHIVKNDIARIVISLFDFLNYHFAFFHQFVFGKLRRSNQFAQNVDRQFQIVLQHFGIKSGKFTGSIGVGLSAHIFDIFGNGRGRTAGGAFEYHMFKKMGNTVHVFPFISRTGIDPDPERNGFKLRILQADNSQSVV